MARQRTARKSDIVRRICQTTSFQRADVKFLIEKFLDEVVEELAQGGRLEFRDFGVFKAALRKGRSARNPRTGKAIDIPDTVVARFAPARLVKQRLAELDPGILDNGKLLKGASKEGKADA